MEEAGQDSIIAYKLCFTGNKINSKNILKVLCLRFGGLLTNTVYSIDAVFSYTLTEIIIEVRSA